MNHENSAWTSEHPKEAGHYWVRLVRLTPTQKKDLSPEEQAEAKAPFVVRFFKSYEGTVYSYDNGTFMHHNEKRLEYAPAIPPK